MPRICIAPNCKTQRSFGKPGGKAEFCLKHCPEGYVSLNKKAKRCSISNCLRIAMYGLRGGSKQFCQKHSDPNIHICWKYRLCHYPGCQIARAKFSLGKFCEKHTDVPLPKSYLRQIQQPEDESTEEDLLVNFDNEILLVDLDRRLSEDSDFLEKFVILLRRSGFKN